MTSGRLGDDDATVPIDRPPLAIYVVLRDVKTGRMFEATAARVRLGRSPECEIPVPAAPHEGVSRVHCEFGLDAYGSIILLDSGSTNGTLLNGQPVTAATRVTSKQAIALGDTGPTLFIETARIVPKR